jgi:hypothetical protein
MVLGFGRCCAPGEGQDTAHGVNVEVVEVVGDFLGAGFGEIVEDGSSA